MPITVLSDVILPTKVIAAGGLSGKSQRLNQRTPHGETGQMSINAVWSQSLREYTFGTVPMLLKDWQAVRAIFEITMGGAFGFLIEDPTEEDSTTGALTLVDGAYQLQRRFIDQGSGRYTDVVVTRPRASKFALAQNGIPLASGAYTLDDETGKLTISGSPDPETLSWSGNYYVPVHFKEDVLDWDMVLGGQMKNRLIAGPSVVLQEVRE